MDFPVPDFLDKLDIEALHASMLEQLPKDIDASEGGPVWDLTRPTAYITAEMAQYVLPWFLSQIWAQYAAGPYLDMHAQRRAMARRQAVPAAGTLVVTGQPGFYIPPGAVFSTAGGNGVDPVEFLAAQGVELGEGPAEVPVEAAVPGSGGNVAANTILLTVSDRMAGVASVTNPLPTTGGYDQEDDETLRARILEYDRNPGSFIGNPADYKRWAMAVTGVGGATVIPAQDNSGTVTIVLVDANGYPAPEQLCQAVYRYIMEGDNPAGQRLAPLNALLAVKPPEALALTVSAVIELVPGTEPEAVRSGFLQRVNAYFDTAREDGEIRFTRIAALLSAVPGVHDYRALLVNGGQANIPLPDDMAPTISAESVSFSEGVV